jgi:hypothetical protein
MLVNGLRWFDSAGRESNSDGSGDRRGCENGAHEK